MATSIFTPEHLTATVDEISPRLKDGSYLRTVRLDNEVEIWMYTPSWSAMLHAGDTDSCAAWLDGFQTALDITNR